MIVIIDLLYFSISNIYIHENIAPVGYSVIFWANGMGLLLYAITFYLFRVYLIAFLPLSLYKNNNKAILITSNWSWKRTL